MQAAVRMPVMSVATSARERYETLCRAIFGTEAAPAALTFIDTLLPDGPASTFQSDVTDDGSPFELSVVLHPKGRDPELRILTESPSVDGSFRGTVQGGQKLAAALERSVGGFARAKKVLDLFLPDAPEGPFALWFAAGLDRAGKAKPKLYFNPKVRGESSAPAVVEEAFARLGLASSFRYVAEAMARGPHLDDLRFFSLDLEDTPEARVKAYVFHRDATLADIVRVAGIARVRDDERLATFVRTIAGGDGRLSGERQVGTCLTFVGGGAPVGATTHVPVRVWAGNDAVARARIEVAAEELGLDAEPYRRAIDVFAKRDLAAGRGIHSYASLRTEASGARLNVYLSPELYAVEPSRAVRRPGVQVSALETPTEVVDSYEEKWPITSHPFLARVAREENSVSALALVLLNFRVAITRDFARRLANVVGRVEEDDVRCIIAQQLAEELGSGDYARAHKNLFEKLAGGMEVLRPEGDLDALLEPGKRLGEKIEELYVQRDAYEGLGATLIMEVYGRQVDQFIGQQLRRQTKLPEAVVEWLTLHEELEVEHVDEVKTLARVIPSGEKALASARGARELGLAGWRFFDELYEMHYGK